VTFEVERFEWADDDRLELEGRWFGLRGTRFIRPTLEVEVDGEPRRLLALMEHKPWAAEEGEDWLAAFAWKGERGEIAAELAVGSDLTFELPRPGGGKPGKASPKRLASAAADVVQPARRRHDGLERRVAEAERARSEALSETQALRRALEQKERTVRELQQRLAEQDEVTQVREPAVHETAPSPYMQDERVPELQAQAARVPLLEDELARVRQETQRKLDAAVAARDAARAQAEEAKRERYEAQGALAAAERELARAGAERDDARSTAGAERRQLRHERDTAVAERDAALTRLEDTRRERDQARLARDATRAERPQVEGVAEVVRKRGPRALPWIGRSDRTQDDLLALRFTALVALSVVCLLVAIWILLAA
jgi:hypothetical protein